MMRGTGVSHGAVSVINGIPCGIGSTIGIDLETRAVMSGSDSAEVIIRDRPGMSTLLAETCVRRTREHLGADTGEGYRLEIESDIPASMGLKSSSSVCNAVISAVLDAYGAEMDPLDMIRLGVGCAKECRVTVTGAFDDACGCWFGGLVITDNTKDELILRKDIPDYDVVLCIPDRQIPKSKVPADAYRKLSEEYRRMVPKIEYEYLTILTENGRFVEGIIGSEGIASKALALGALAAGITGTGPATAVIVPKGEGERMAGALGCRTMLAHTR